MRNVRVIIVQYSEQIPYQVVANRTYKQAPITQLGNGQRAGIYHKTAVLIFHQ